MINALVEHLFRHQYGKLVSTLTRIFGIDNLDLVEDVVQETLLKALRHWSFHGVPQNPAGWLYQCAKNQALDLIRREAVFRRSESRIVNELTEWTQSSESTDGDDQLLMIFACCHPSLAPDSRVALTLKAVCGFGTGEIARAFLSSETTVAQRLVRSKRKLRDERVRLEVPTDLDLTVRLKSILEVLYLMFNEGYTAHRGANLVRFEMCGEALRLVQLLLEHPACDHPSVHALASLMLFQAARLHARQDTAGRLLLLSEQDRSLWDSQFVQQAVFHLSKSQRSTELTTYHLEAGIAACHSLAPSYEETNWRQILAYYDTLISLNPSPVVALNRAVALSMIEGPETGIVALKLIQHQPAMRDYYLFHSTLGELCHRAGLHSKARDAYLLAMDLAGSEPERRFLLEKLQCSDSQEC